MRRHIRHKIIPALTQDHLIGIHEIRLFALRRKHPVHIVMLIAEGDLPLLSDRIVEPVDVRHHALAVRLADAGKVRDMPDLLPEIPVAQALKLFDQTLRLPFRERAGGKHAVDQEAELRLLEKPLGKTAPALHRNLVGHIPAAAELLQRLDIASHRTPVAFDAIDFFQLFHDLLLQEMMVIIGIVPQNLKDHEREQLFPSGCTHRNLSFASLLSESPSNFISPLL